MYKDENYNITDENIQDGINSRLDIVKEKISELEITIMKH